MIVNRRADTNELGRDLHCVLAINTYTLRYAPGSGGTLSGGVSQTVNYNMSGTAVTAIPDTGYKFATWSDGSTANPRTDSRVVSNKTMTAAFTKVIKDAVDCPDPADTR